MNCDTIDTILDEHRTARLSQSERQAVTAHLASCARCSDSWAAHAALLGEDLGEPSPELFARVQRRAAAAAAQAVQPRRSYRTLTALAGAAAVVAVVLVLRPWVTAPEPGGEGPGGAVAAPVAQAFVAGRDYELLARPAPTAATDKIAVTEFFMYPCAHCFAFEDELDDWAARSADLVALTRVPAVFNAQAELLARAFYAAEVLGKRDAMHAAFYGEIHTRGNVLSSREALAELFARFDVDAATFAAAFDSAAVNERVQAAVALGREYGIRATPSLVVAGRYSTNPTLAGARVLAVVDQLAAEERRAAACSAAPRTAPSAEDSAYCAFRNSR
jgi:protein dithiol oxidoreductase (disulfide-forming)